MTVRSIETLAKKRLGRFFTQHPRASRRLVGWLRAFGNDRRAGQISQKIGYLPREISLRPPSRLGGGRFKMYAHGGKDLIVANLWFKGWAGFEYPLPDVFAALSKTAGESLVLDVGANTGFYSLIATSINAKAEVHAFEPFPPVHDLLLLNLNLNNQRRVRVFNQAVSDTTGATKLYVPLQDHGLIESSCSLNPNFKESHSAVVNVAQVTIDEHLKQYPNKPVSLLKVDVEGFEDHVLIGAKDTLARHRPSITLEVLSNMDQHRLDQLRRELGYTSYKFLDGRIVREDRVQFDDRSWNHLWLPEEAGFSKHLVPWAENQ